jgi:hypothetical protein
MTIASDGSVHALDSFASVFGGSRIATSAAIRYPRNLAVAAACGENAHGQDAQRQQNQQLDSYPSHNRAPGAWIARYGDR